MCSKVPGKLNEVNIANKIFFYIVFSTMFISNLFIEDKDNKKIPQMFIMY